MDDPALGIVQTPQFFRSLASSDVGGALGRVRHAGGVLPVGAAGEGPVRVGAVRRLQRPVPAHRPGSRPTAASLSPLRGGLPHRARRPPKHGFRPEVPAHSAGDGDLPAERGRVHAAAVPVVQRGHVAGVARSHVAVPDAVQRPAFLHRRVDVELHHRPPDPDPAADPDHPAGVPAGGDPLCNAVLLIPAVVTGTVSCLPAVAQRPVDPGDLPPIAIAVGWAQILGLWDFARGKVMTWHPTIGPVDAPRRFRKCVVGFPERHPRHRLGLPRRVAHGPGHVRPFRHCRPARPGQSGRRGPGRVSGEGRHVNHR